MYSTTQVRLKVGKERVLNLSALSKQRAISYRKAQDSTEHTCHWQGMNMTWKAQSQCSVIRKWRKVKEELEKENWRQMEDQSFLQHFVREHCTELWFLGGSAVAGTHNYTRWCTKLYFQPLLLPLLLLWQDTVAKREYSKVKATLVTGSILTLIPNLDQGLTVH